jgi:hypothetical protein
MIDRAEPQDPYIAGLEADKRAIELKIKELDEQLRTINNLIYKRKMTLDADNLGITLNKKNFNRILLESVIKVLVSKSRDGLRTSEIYDALSDQMPGINYATVRSYVTRMRDKGALKKNPTKRYSWIVGSE